MKQKTGEQRGCGNIMQEKGKNRRVGSIEDMSSKAHSKMDLPSAVAQARQSASQAMSAQLFCEKDSQAGYPSECCRVCI